MNSTMEPTSPLMRPYDLGDLRLPNRVALAPMTRSRAGVERLANSLMAEYYVQRASAGLLISEGVAISPQAIGWRNTPGIYTEAMVEAWKTVTSAVHAAGGRIFMQLWHCGRASHSAFHDGAPPVAPSAVRLQGDHIHTPSGKQPYETPRALETREVPGVIEQYRWAAQRAREAGFDGVEVHGANGYLVDEFLQSKTNQRTDQYGGSVENRFRFLREIVDSLLTVWPASRVGVRLSPNGVFNDMGSPDCRETFLYAARELDRYRLGYLHVLDGLAFGFHQQGPPVTLADLREVYHGTLMGNCGYEQETAEETLRRGDADLIAFGRPYISNPDLVERFANRWPLNPPADMAVWYSFDPAGYTDFPAYSPS